MFDYVVVGGGSAGCVVASRLSEDPQVRVCLIEAGAADRSALIHCPAGLAALIPLPIFNWAFKTQPNQGMYGRVGYQPRGKVLGGSSSINGMMYMRGDRSDYDRWAAEGNAGWGYDDVLPYFKKAEHNETWGADRYHGAGGPLNVADVAEPSMYSRAFVQAGMQAGYPPNPDFNGARLEGVGLTQVTQKDGERCSAAKAYITPNMGRANLHVITNARATRILMDGKRATGVEYRDGEGRRQQVLASCEVIVSAGALQSPQLLMLSGIGPLDVLRQHGIAVVHESPGVGRNLQDHIDIVHSYTGAASRGLFGLSLTGAWSALKGVFTWSRHRRGPLTTNFAEGNGYIKTAPQEPVPDVQLVFLIAKIMNHGRTILFGNGYSVHVGLLRPKSRGSVSLASSDPLAPPRIDTNFLSDPDDVERLVRGFKQVRHIMRQPALRRFGGRESAISARARSDTEIARFVRAHADCAYHPVGTCRMGGGPLDVVDERLRVKGVQALRVVDASIMPHIVSGNTNAPTIMIGEKAAAMIKADNAAVMDSVTSAQPSRPCHPVAPDA